MAWDSFFQNMRDVNEGCKVVFFNLFKKKIKQSIFLKEKKKKKAFLKIEENKYVGYTFIFRLSRYCI